jgi:hypothetical protein
VNASVERNAAEMDPYDRYVTGARDALPMRDELYPWTTEGVRNHLATGPADR